MPSARRELFLIDGNSLAYRAFFALPESIATSKGMPTNAIFGFASMLVKILTEFGPAATVVAWDAGMSGRERDYPEYKAQRQPRPDLLCEQWPHLQPLVEAFGYRNVKVPDYEADDVIATLAGRAREREIEVMIVTGDRDAFQLIEPGVRVMATSRGITDTKIYDRDAVIERYGIGPERIPDFIALKGDSSDNIPGVPGIGDKTAAALLQQFGDVEGVLANVDKISGQKRKENLVNHADDARISKQLATAIRDVELDIDLERCVAEEPDRSRLREVFSEFELREPLARIEASLGDGVSAASIRPETALKVTATRAAAADLATLAGPLATLAAERPLADAVDGDGATGDGASADKPAAQLADRSIGEDEIETATLGLEDLADVPLFDPGLEGGLQFGGYAGGDAVLVGEAEGLAPVLEGWGERPLVAHDWKSIATADYRCATPPLAHDTMVAAYLIDPARRRYPLIELAEQEGLGAIVEGAGELSGVAERAVVTRALAERQLGQLEDSGLTHLFRDIELPLVEVLIAMERAGIKLDRDRLAEIAVRFSDRIAALEQEVYELAGVEFTIGSPQQLAEVLFERLALPRKRRGKTGFSTDARVLAAIRTEHPIVSTIERWRELTKLKNTYIDALPALIDPETERLHTTFNQAATATGRLSSTNPNLQNVPIRTELGREIRACFGAAAGTRLISADYSQVELRVLAQVCGEDALKEIFRSGGDVHAATAGEIFGVRAEEVDAGLRSKAKMVNFGIVYGLSPFGLADRLQIPQEEAAEFIDRYLNRFPKVREFIDTTVARATADGFVTTLFGRIRRIPELRARQRQTRMLGERLAVNTVIQGTAADIIKIAMVRCHHALRAAGLSTLLILQIHDELLFEAPEAEVERATEVVRRAMAEAAELDPPLAVDIGTGANWLEAK